MDNDVVLSVEGLSLGVEELGQSLLALTDDVSFELKRGEMTALVGESGCGKSITAMATMGILPGRSGRRMAGRVMLDGRDLYGGQERDWRTLRGREMAMIFQEPTAAMNPLMSVRRQMEEVFNLHGRKVDRQRIEGLLEEVGIVDIERVLGSYPHELSGGMLQRVMISMALLLEPRVLIADEPTTALDVTVQAQVMEILNTLMEKTGTAILLITHNLALVAQYAQRLNVMYAGRVVERSMVEDFFNHPSHPYAQGLLGALPDLYGGGVRPIAGQVPSPCDYPDGCRFAPRCTHRMEICEGKPSWTVVSSDHEARCFLLDEK